MSVAKVCLSRKSMSVAAFLLTASLEVAGKRQCKQGVQVYSHSTDNISGGEQCATGISALLIPQLCALGFSSRSLSASTVSTVLSSVVLLIAPTTETVFFATVTQERESMYVCVCA